ncbi:putative family 18 [Lyophyllum shimeji]|uniref:Family 18 n=1 Tax=Lyophyllum shimeji TaxID=47721 RepID=A0A9P3PSR3_LYOSH|nr:putative family 18 [Lyophyllum shimeji]
MYKRSLIHYSVALTSSLLLVSGFTGDYADTNSHSKRADCKTTTVVSGDGCASLAARCGLDGNKFMSYNPGLDCSKLAVDQWVCCTSGTLPSKRPNENPNGTCYSVPIVDGSNCAAFETKYDVTEDEINKWNAHTWRWTNCSGLQPGMNICLSPGTPPLPAQNSSIPCGLESVGNKTCPLKACCGKWGFCGLTEDFCTENKGGAPGTGCQSNCQLLSDFDKVGGGVPSRNVIGYYSNWASSRVCNGVPNTVVPAVRPKDLDPFGYSHIVYSFAYVSRGDWKLTETQSNDKDLIAELQALKKTNPALKTMWAVGGWVFNDPPTQDIFSQMVSTSANRAAFIKNAISQLQSYGFDGLDIDWEYPGTERGGAEDDGKNFLLLLQEFQTAIDKSGRPILLSITAPASYWYLQQFPIVDIAKNVDWINLMTYDIHGAWDIKFGTGVLPHTAIPEVNAAVDMFVKAGVPLKSVNLGIGFYGRTFTLANPSCNTAGCPMKGGGNGGPCTGTSGYLAYGEIDYLIQTKGLKPKYNATSQTMVLTYDDQWIGYENPDTIANKLKYVIKRSMPGVLIWAADLDLNNQLLNAIIGASGRPVMSATDCPADGIWPRTPAGTTASVPCDMGNKAGPKQIRACGGPAWGNANAQLCELGEAMAAAFGHCAGEL